MTGFHVGNSDGWVSANKKASKTFVLKAFPMVISTCPKGSVNNAFCPIKRAYPGDFRESINSFAKTSNYCF
jgi:hypothetical protein